MKKKKILILFFIGLIFLGTYLVYSRDKIPQCNNTGVQDLLSDVVSSILVEQGEKDNTMSFGLTTVRYDINYIVDHKEIGYDKERFKRACSADFAYNAVVEKSISKIDEGQFMGKGKVNYTVFYDVVKNMIYVEASIQE